MKVITSIDEALEAERENRLVFLKECSFEKVGTTWCDQVFGAIKREALGLKPEEVKLVEYKYRDTLYYLSQECERPPVLWKATGRTLTGVIDSE